MTNKIMTVSIWIIILCMTRQTKQEQADCQSWCSVKEAFGGDVTLTCTFDQDISTLKQNVYLHHESSNGREKILIYDWTFGGNMFKLKNYGVHLEGNVTYSLTAKMYGSLKHGGYYRCDVGASEGNECELIEDVQSWCSVNEAFDGDVTRLTCNFDQDISASKQNIHLQHETSNRFQDILLYDRAVPIVYVRRHDYQLQLEGHLTNSMTAKMNVSLKHAGYYRCVVGASIGQECKLIIKDVQSWCSVNEAFDGDVTRLTCNFDQDISASKQNIHLQHKTSNRFQDILLYDRAVPIVHVRRHDYQLQLEGHVTNSLTVKMNVSLKHAGYYRCVVGTSEGKECKLIIKDNTKNTRNKQVMEDIFTWLIESEAGILLTQGIIFLFSLLLLGFFVIWIIRRKSKCCKRIT